MAKKRTKYYFRSRDFYGRTWIVEVDSHIDELKTLKQALKAFDEYVNYAIECYNKPETKYAGREHISLYQRIFSEDGYTIGQKRLKCWNIKTGVTL